MGKSGREETKVALLEAMCRKHNVEGVKSVIFTREGEKVVMELNMESNHF